MELCNKLNDNSMMNRNLQILFFLFIYSFDCSPYTNVKGH